MKGYGYKDVSVGSAYAEYVELRFAITLFSGLAMVFTKAISGDWFGNLYVACWFAYTIIAYLPELFKSLKVYPLLATSITVIVLSFFFKQNIFGHNGHHGIFSMDKAETTNINIPAFEIFIFYQSLIVFVCILYVYAQWKKNI